MPASGHSLRTSGPAPSAWPLWPLPLACAALFLIAIHGSLLLGIAAGQLGFCNPYGLDCHSISATGRALPAKLLFKPLLIVASSGLLLYWALMSRWLRVQGLSGGRPPQVAGLGMAGALCLIAYTAALGEGGDSALLLRRLGAVLGFSLNFLAQLLLTYELRRVPGRLSTTLATPLREAGYEAVPTVMWRLVVAMLALGLASALFAPLDWHGRIDDGIEWWLALFLNLHVMLAAFLWRATGFRL